MAVAERRVIEDQSIIFNRWHRAMVSDWRPSGRTND
jgi:hypothetical protein